MKVNYALMPLLTSEGLAEVAGKKPGDGYPPTSQRLIIPAAEWPGRDQLGRLILPDDPRWHIADHPNRDGVDPALLNPVAVEGYPMSIERALMWKAMGLQIDQLNRPVHPRISELITTIGMFTGLGRYWRYGPQFMSNLILRRVRGGEVSYAVVGVMRGSLKRSVPGGHDEAGETSEQAAFREGHQEAGIVRATLGDISVEVVPVWPKGGKSDTAHAWGQESFVCVRSLDNPALEGVELQPDGAEAIEASWMTLQQIRSDLYFVTTHRNQIFAYEALLRGRAG